MSRTEIEEFSRQFESLHMKRLHVVRSSRHAELFGTVQASDPLWPKSPAILVARSAAVVERMINGITVRLWDDPFEWTLPERMPASADLISYFNEVEEARIRGFGFLKDDADLERLIPAPTQLETLKNILGAAIERSREYLSAAKTLIDDQRFIHEDHQ